MAHDFLFKFILAGDSSVGKTAILQRFADADFKSATEYEATVGVDFKTKNVSIEDKEVMIMTWDTAGQETYRSFTRSYFRGSAVVLLVYDVTSRSSFDSIPSWIKDVLENVDNPNLGLVIVGNKKDSASRKVQTEEGAALAAQNGDLLFFETSAKTGEGVHEVFILAAKQFYKKFQDGLVDFTSDSQGLTLGPRQINQSGKCSC